MTDSSPGEVVVTHRLVDVSAAGPELTGALIAADIFTPRRNPRPMVFCCLSGGGLSRRYWDLRYPDDDTYSFARWMAGNGFTVICIDHLGTGDSALPDGAKAPLLHHVIAANAAAFGTLCDELRDSGITTAAIPDLRRIGVGHSMGAALTVRQQAVHDTYDAICLLGFGTRGLPSALSPEILSAYSDVQPGDERLAELTLLMFGAPYPVLSNGNDGAEPMQQALAAIATPLLGAGGMLSLLPGNVAPEARRIRVPVLVLNGARDSLIADKVPEAEQYAESIDFTGYLVPDSGHNHNIARNRQLFWRQLRRWAESVNADLWSRARS